MSTTTRIYIEQLVLEVPAGVTLAGERGNNGSRGALLTSDALKTPVMIRAGGPDVRITGLRLQGPCPKRYHESALNTTLPDKAREKAITELESLSHSRRDVDG